MKNITREGDANKQIFQAYKRRIMTEGLKPGEVKQSTRYNVIQYLCSFPHLDPDEMAAAIIREGVTVAFDDSSISQRENAAHERRVRRLLQAKAQPRQRGERRKS